MLLSEQQLRFFETFGYLALPGLFRDDIDALNHAFREVWAANGGGLEGASDDLNERLTVVVPFIDQHAYLSALIDDPRIHDIGVSVCGEDFNYKTSDGNLYSGDTPWHSDCSFGAKISIKLAFYLDRLDAASGSLRVIPGSHHKGGRFSQMLNAIDYYRAPPDARTGLPEAAWGVPGHDVPATALVTEPGDVLVFHHELKHSSFGGGSRRRMFTINMQAREPEDNLEPIRKALSDLARHGMERAYGDVMIETASPERMVHLEQRLANDGHLAALTAKVRAERAAARG